MNMDKNAEQMSELTVLLTIPRKGLCHLTVLQASVSTRILLEFSLSGHIASLLCSSFGALSSCDTVFIMRTAEEMDDWALLQ